MNPRVAIVMNTASAPATIPMPNAIWTEARSFEESAISSPVDLFWKNLLSRVRRWENMVQRRSRSRILENPRIRYRQPKRSAAIERASATIISP